MRQGVSGQDGHLSLRFAIATSRFTGVGQSSP